MCKKLIIRFRKVQKRKRERYSDDFTSILEITHVFYAKENDWGYSSFLHWNVSIN